MIPTFDYTGMGFNNVWLWADTHFGHEVARVESKRPWGNVDRMDNALIRNACKIVGDKDLLIMVGDITMAGTSRAHYVARLVSQFPGNNVLVYGNHDKFKPSWYLEHGFMLAATSLVLPGGILVTHDPAEVEEWPLDKPVLCGHVHEAWRSIDNVVNVGVDSWDYKPVLLQDALAICTETRKVNDWKKISKSRHGVNLD